MNTSDQEEATVNNAERALELLGDSDTDALSSFLEELHPVDLTKVISALDPESQPAVLRHVRGLDQISALVSYGEALRPLVLPFLDDSRIAAIARRLEDDEAADVIGELPRRRQVSVLRRLSPQRARELLSLLAYDQATAGALMTTGFVSFPPTEAAESAIQKLRDGLASEELDPDTEISNVYVTDQDMRLLGVISLRELLGASRTETLETIMLTTVISVGPDDDQEHVIQITKDYALKALPVVAPENGKLLGIITVDDVLDVMEEESTEDILRLAGTEEADYVGASVFTAMKARLPWLFASWIGGLAGASLLGGFSDLLQRYVALAFFMPIVFGMGGNVGSQSSTITVRGLALGDLLDNRVSRRVRDEAIIGALLGICFGTLLGIASFVLFRDAHLSEVVALSIACTMTVSASMGSMIPVLFKRHGFDPAVASGPLVTTLTDILSIIIYFSTASILL